MNTLNKYQAVLGAMVLTLGGATAQANLTFNLNQGSRSARADFSVSGNQLQIVLENMATQGTTQQSDTLTGIWFNAGSGVTFTSGFVGLSSGSYMVNPWYANNDPNHDGLDNLGGISGEWGVEHGPDATAYFPAYDTVIANSGLDNLVGTDDLLRDANGHLYHNLDSPGSPDGINYGIVSYAGLGRYANRKLRREPLVAGGVVITLDFTGNLNLDNISDVLFNYGTSVNTCASNVPPSGNPPPVPAPNAALLAMIGFSFVCTVGRRFL